MWILWFLGGIAAVGAIGGWRFHAWTVPALLCVCVLAWWTSPIAYGRSLKRAAVLALPESERRVVIYWRPGCRYCQRLRGALGRDARQAKWVNIWQDPEAAAFVRSVNGGNETVPTVVLDGEPLTNPDPQVVLRALGGNR